MHRRLISPSTAPKLSKIFLCSRCLRHRSSAAFSKRLLHNKVAAPVNCWERRRCYIHDYSSHRSWAAVSDSTGLRPDLSESTQGAGLDVVELQLPGAKPNFIDLLDPFLPPALRISNAISEEIRPPQHLPRLLHDLRQHVPNGLLSLLLLETERLESFRFLADALTGIAPPRSSPPDELELMHGSSPWPHHVFSQSTLTAQMQQPVIFGVKTESFPAAEQLKHLTLSAPRTLVDDSAQLQEAIGEVWLAVGQLVVRASQTKDHEASRMMDCVFEVIAAMHTQNHVPQSIYEYDSTNVPQARRKPPYLHVMSSRMMTALSDATWHLQSHDLTSLTEYTDLSTAALDRDILEDARKSHLHTLPTSLWLELILWCCTTNGHFAEAGKLLSLVFSPSNAVPWTVLSWEEVLQLQTDHHKRQQSWFDQVASVTEGWSEDKPLIEMPEKTLSSEIVQVVLDGLLARAHESVDSRALLSSTLEILVDSAVARPSPTKSLEINSALNQVLDLAPIDAATMADICLDARNSTLPASQQSSSTAVQDDADYDSLSNLFPQNGSASIGMFLAIALDHCVAQGMIAKAEELFTKILRLRNESAAADDGNAFTVEIPHATLADFLDLAIRTDRMSTAKAILYSSGLVPHEAIRIDRYKPALLRASLSFSDHSLLEKTLQNCSRDLDTLPNDVLEALLEAQIRLSKLHSIDAIMNHLCQRRHVAPSPRVVTSLAAKLLDKPSNLAGDRKNRQAVGHLRQFLGRMFVPPRLPSQLPDYTAHRQVSQLARIFASAGGQLAEVAAEFAEVGNAQLASPVPIPAAAFNVLLEAVACAQGWQAARALFERWCGFAALGPTTEAAADVGPTRAGNEVIAAGSVGDEAAGAASDATPDVVVVDGLPAHAPRFGDTGDQVVTPDIASVRAVLWPNDPDEVLRSFYRARSFSLSGRPVAADSQPSLVRWRGENGRPRRRDWAAVQLPPQVKWAVEQYRRMHLDDEAIEGLIPSLREQWEAP